MDPNYSFTPCVSQVLNICHGLNIDLKLSFLLIHNKNIIEPKTVGSVVIKPEKIGHNENIFVNEQMISGPL